MHRTSFLKQLSKKLLIGGLLLMSLLVNTEAQVTVQLDKITVDSQGVLNLWVKSTENGKLKRGIKREDVQVAEFVNEQSDTLGHPQYLKEVIQYDENDSTSEKSTILFLLDLSAEMEASDLEDAKQMIQEVFTERSDNTESTFYLTAFHEEIVLDKELVKPENIDGLLASLRRKETAPDFFRVLRDELRYLKGIQGTKSIFIFGSGVNSTAGERYLRQLPYTASEMEDMVKSLPFDFHIFGTVFQKANSDDLHSLTWENTHISLADSQPLEDYPAILGNNKRVRSNYLIQVAPGDREFKGEKRVYSIDFDGISDERDFRLGSASFPIDLQRQTPWSTWLLWLIIGLILVLVVLGIGSVLLPFIKERSFVKKYVAAHVQEDRRVKYDLFYNEPIQNGTLVVNKCRQTTPFSSWKENGWQCPNYPMCLDQNCNGGGAPELNSFSSMEGVYLKMNWIWFGAIGGFLAWVIITLARVTNFQVLNGIIRSLLGEQFLQSISQDNPDLITRTIGENLLVGISFSIGMLVMLSWMEERRASNNYAPMKSVGRIALRTFVGVILSMFIFFLGFYFQYLLGVAPYLSGLISWLLFGIALGVIISFDSTISAANGIIGGVIATLVAFHVYWLLNEVLGLAFLQANLFSMILMGAIIGSILVSVVTTLEDFELEVIAPAGFERTIPISKWLKNNIGVMIGKEPGSYIYIKWDDPEVRPEHAELFLENGKVYVRPIEEVLVNRNRVSKPTPLKDGDLLRLGRASFTQFRFVEK